MPIEYALDYLKFNDFVLIELFMSLLYRQGKAIKFISSSVY